jgi:BirA family biotin operon repressor/biotin-[acetyl-CoA-carboxylase] ligase
LKPEQNPIGVPFIELQTTDSTNNYAMGMVHEGVAQHGLAVFAHEQTAGKGQRNKQWQAQPGANLMMSVVIEPAPLFARPDFRFSMAMASAAHGLLKKWAGDDLKIKWPNDMYFRDRKAGGILIENVLSSSGWKAAVVGMGFNINQTDFGNLQHKAVSLKQITGRTFDTIALAKELCGSIDAVLKKLTKEAEAVDVYYQEQLYKKGKRVRLKQGQRVFEAEVKGVNGAGQLVVQHAMEEVFDVGSVEWVIV